MESSDLIEELVPALPNANPNVPDGTDELPIHPVSLMDAAPLTSVHVLPRKLDITLLRHSIQVLTSVIPSISSRYRVDYPSDGAVHSKYWFSLDRKPIPFSYQTMPRDEPFPGTGHHVNQEVFGNLRHPLPASALWPNTDSPMAAFRYTSFASSLSCVGITLVHIVADAATHYMIINLLSRIYEAGGSVDHLMAEDYPMYDIGLPRPRPASEFTNPPPLIVTALLEVSAESDSTVANSSPSAPVLVQLKLSPTEIKALKAESQKLIASDSSPLSTMDVITGWLASLPLRNREWRTDTIIYVVDMRAIGLVPGNFAGDAVLVMDVDVRDENRTSTNIKGTARACRIAYVASKIRAALVRIRSDPQLVSDWMDISANRLESALLAKQKPAFAFNDKTVFLNSYFRTDWGPITFGCPRDEVRYYFAAPLEHQPRVYKSHLEKGQTGAERGVAVEFKVLPGEYDKAMEAIREDRRRWNGNRSAPKH